MIVPWDFISLDKITKDLKLDSQWILSYFYILFSFFQVLLTVSLWDLWAIAPNVTCPTELSSSLINQWIN